jgi:hypothetical protein
MFASLFGRHVRGSREDHDAETSQEVWSRFAEHLESLLCFMHDIMNPQQINQTSRTSVEGYWQTVKTKAEGMGLYANLGEADLRKLGTYALWQEQSGAIDELKQALSQFRSGAKDFGELAGSLTSGRYPPTQSYLDRMNDKAFAHCASGLEPVLFGLAPLLKSGLVPRSDVDRLLRFLVDEGAVEEFYSIF